MRFYGANISEVTQSAVFVVQHDAANAQPTTGSTSDWIYTDLLCDCVFVVVALVNADVVVVGIGGVVVVFAVVVFVGVVVVFVGVVGGIVEVAIVLGGIIIIINIIISNAQFTTNIVICNNGVRYRSGETKSRSRQRNKFVRALATDVSLSATIVPVRQTHTGTSAFIRLNDFGSLQ